MSPTYILLFLHSFISFTDSDSTNDLKELNWISIVIVVVCLVILILLIVGIYFFIKKRKYFCGQPHCRSDSDLYFW